MNQKTVYAYAQNSYRTIQELDLWGAKFEKDEIGDYPVRKVHRLGTYVLPMPEGHHMKKILYRQSEAQAGRRDRHALGVDEAQIALEKVRIAAPLANANSIPPSQLEYTLRRMVNDYLRKMQLALERFAEI